MEVDNIKDKFQQYLIEFNHGHYTNCRIILEEIFNEKRTENIPNKTLNDIIIQNNIIVCKCLENLVDDTTVNFLDLKYKLKVELDKLRSVPRLCIDSTLALVFNAMALFWFENNYENTQINFEEQLNIALPSLCRVLEGGTSTHVKLEQIKLAFTFSHSTFELLDERQAMLLNAIRVLMALAAQDEFLVKISLRTNDSLSLPHVILCSDRDREGSLPILLMPVLYGQAKDLQNLNVREALGNLNLALATLLARLKKYRPALSCLTENYESLELRALAIYLKAYIHSQSNMKLEAQKLLEGLFAMKAGREGELGCRGRILQAKLIHQSGKHQQAVNILRQATKNHGDKWILLDALAEMYSQHNQEETVVRTLELFIQCLLVTEEGLQTFQSRLLHCLHGQTRPSISKMLYRLANVHRKLKNYTAGSEKMLQLLARQEEVALCDGTLPSLRTLLREASLLLYEAGKLDEACVVCTRATICDISSPSQGDLNAKWLDDIKQDVTALLILAHIHIAEHRWTETLAALDRCVCELQKSKPPPGPQLDVHSRLLSTALFLTTKVYQAIKDDANTKHAFYKAMQADKGDREIVLLFMRHLLVNGEDKEAHKIWFSVENKCKRQDLYESSDQVLTFLLAPKLSDTQFLDIEKQIKISIFNSRK